MNSLSTWFAVSPSSPPPATRARSRSLFPTLARGVLFVLTLTLILAAVAQAQNFPPKTILVAANVETFANGYGDVGPWPTCAVGTQGTMTVTTAPQYGTTRIYDDNDAVASGYPCFGVVVPFTTIDYTWTSTQPGATQDHFTIHYTDEYGSANQEFYPTLNTGQPSKDLGSAKNKCNCAGDPITISTGNMYYQAEDYSTALYNRMGFTRYYNSRNNISSPTFATTLAVNWRSTYDRYIRLASASSVNVERADGQQLTFTLTNGTWTPDSDVDVTLAQTGSGIGSTWTLKDNTDTTETYTTISATEAQLNTIASLNGYTLTMHYNASNQLTEVSDSYGRTLNFTYASNGLLQTLATPDNTTLTYGYSSSVPNSGILDQLASVTYSTTPASNVSYKYGENSAPPFALTSMTDENGNVYASWTYDQYSRALTSQHAGGADKITVAYDDMYGGRTVTNALNMATYYTFTTLQGVSKVTSLQRDIAPYTVVSFGYDSRGYLASTNGWSTPANYVNFVNDSHGQPTTINEGVATALARTTTITYDSTFVHLPKTIITAGLTSGFPGDSPLKIAFTYDNSGEVLTKTLTDTTTTSQPYSTNGQTRTWTYTWSNGTPATAKSPNGNTTTFTFSGNGELTQISNALSQKTQFTSYTGGGLLLTVIDPNNVTTTLAYDQRQRLLSSQVSGSGGNFTTTYTYDAAGNLTKTNLPDNSYLANTFDTAHRVTKVANVLGDYLQYTLDALGDKTQVNTYDSSSSLWRQQSGTFDILGRRLTYVGGMGQTTTYTYDGDSDIATVKDGLSHTTTRLFDVLDRLSTSTDANNGAAQFAYNAYDGVTSVTDANGNATAYVLDGFGEPIQQTSPDTGTTIYHYDADGNLTQKVDGAGVTVNMSYDALDRIKTRTYPADSTQNVTYGYDNTNWNYGFGVGRLSWFTDAAGQMNFGYDERGNIGWTQRSSGSNTFSTWGTFDAAGRPQGLTYPSGMYVGWTRDAAGNIGYVGLVPPGSQTVQTVAWLAHDPFYGPVHYVTFGNNVRDGIWLDLDYRQTASQVFGTSGNFTYQTYTYDNANNLTGVSDSVHSYNNQTLGYDVVNRLTSATSGTGGYGSFTWTYDKVGNRQSQVGAATTTYGYTSGTNRLASITIGGVQTNVSTNGNGNITSIPANLTTAATFTYNVANRLASVTGSQTGITNVYDGIGQRFSKQDPGSNPTYYTYDTRGNLLEESGPAGVTDYIYLDNTLLGIWLPSTGKLYYVQTDRLGTPQLVTDSNQNAVWTATYQPFGATFPVNSVTQNLRFPGQYSDLETSFNYNGFRDYMPNLGRYLEADPIGLGGGANSYLYASANPFSVIDPDGLAGHHIFPQQFWNREHINIPQEAHDVLDDATIQPPQGIKHGYSGPHADYNQRAEQLFKQWCELRNIDPSKMTAADAADLIKFLQSDPQISKFNAAVAEGTETTLPRVGTGLNMLGAVTTVLDALTTAQRAQQLNVDPFLLYIYQTPGGSELWEQFYPPQTVY